MASYKKQRGLSVLTMLALIVLLVFCGLFAFKVAPMYAENAYVVQGMKSLVEQGESLNEMSDKVIRNKLEQFYAVNNVRSEGPKNIVIKRDADRTVVKVDFEMREHLMYNIDVATTFKNHLDSARPDKCCKPLDEK